MKKVLFPILALVLALGLALPMATVFAHTEEEPQSVGLIAGQNIDVGSVNVYSMSNTYELTVGKLSKPICMLVKTTHRH